MKHQCYYNQLNIMDVMGGWMCVNLCAKFRCCGYHMKTSLKTTTLTTKTKKEFSNLGAINDALHFIEIDQIIKLCSHR